MLEICCRDEDSGKLYFYGILNGSKVKRHINSSVPKRISEHLVARIAKCGTTFIVFVTGKHVLLAYIIVWIIIANENIHFNFRL